MLTELHIQHFVLIDSLDLSFDKGFSVFTGETGAGKSILLDALSLVLGARSETRFVQKGSDQAVVSATFHLGKNHPALEILKDQGLMCDDDLILRRTLTKEGKTKCFVCDQPVSVGLLKTLGETLVEIHGQFATHSLLNPATHLNTLDVYGHLESQVQEVNKACDLWRSAQQAVDDFEQKLSIQQSDEDFMRSSLDELEKLKPQVGEEEQLTQRRTTLMNAERIINDVKNATLILDEEEQGVMHLLSRIDSHLSSADRVTDGGFTNELNTLSESMNLLTDLSDQLNRRLNDLGDTSELTVIDDRLFALRDIARKHHTTIDDLPKLCEKLAQDLNNIEHGEDHLLELKKSAEQARLSYLSMAHKLSEQRHLVAQQLDKAVMQELPDLKLDKATFHVDVVDLAENLAGPTGLNQVTFMVATNKGSDLTPIHKSASGGELARFMLALKVNLAECNQMTLIFDEIDTGISGATASSVGQRLSRLSEFHQTLVITHSPQVAGFGHHHYLVKKSDTDTTTTTSVTPLDDSQRLEEIARLVSGTSITDKSRELARELLRV